MMKVATEKYGNTEFDYEPINLTPAYSEASNSEETDENAEEDAEAENAENQTPESGEQSIIPAPKIPVQLNDNISKNRKMLENQAQKTVSEVNHE